MTKNDPNDLGKREFFDFFNLLIRLGVFGLFYPYIHPFSLPCHSGYGGRPVME